MVQRECGHSGLTLSVLGLGCWSFGGGEYWGPVEQSDVDTVVRRAFELGITYFDTAEAYNDGRSEASLGRALRGLPREQVVIGTKVSPAHVQPDVLPGRCEASLRRLGTDYIDIYMVHWPITLHSIRHFDAQIAVCPAVDDAFAALLRLQEQGKVRHIGVSNFARPRLEEALAYCPNLAVNELPYNLLSRAIEWEALPASRELGLGVIGYMALLQGVLPISTRHSTTSRCGSGAHDTSTRERPQPRVTGCAVKRRRRRQALAALRAVCRDNGLRLSELALKWAVANRDVACNLVGSRSVSKLEANVRAVEHPLSTEMVRRLNAITDPLKERLGRSFDYYEGPDNDRTR